MSPNTRPGDSHAAATRRAVDELAIRRLVDMYFAAVDFRDKQLWRACFADDAEFSSANADGSPAATHVGIEAIVGVFGTVHASVASHHLTGNVAIDLDGDRASARTSAVAVLVFETGERGAQRVLVRGLRYRDELTRAGDDWLIRRREHAPVWQFEAEGGAPSLPEAVMAHLRD